MRLITRITSIALFLSLHPALRANPLQKQVAVQAAQIQSLQNQQLPVGSIVSSLLSERSFQALMSEDWVAMRGQLLPESSKLCQLFRKEGRDCRLPDASGKFFRSVGGQAAPLGEEQADTASLRDLDLKVDIQHDHGAHTHSYSSAQRPTSTTQIVPYGNLPVPSWTDTETNGKAVKLGRSMRSVEVSKRGGGDAPIETRPVNVSVGTYIRIN